jgi:hypothetical protein
MALRELLAVFDVRFSGQAQLAAANKQVEQVRQNLVRSAQAAGLNQQAMARMASGVRAKISESSNAAQVGGVIDQSFDKGGKSAGGTNDIATRVVPAMTKGTTVAAQFGAAVTALRGRFRELADTPGILDRIAGSFGKLAVLGALGYGLSSQIGGLVQEAQGLDRAAKQLGTTTRELDALESSANMAGVGAQSLRTAFRGLYRNMGQASGGAKTAKELFDALGVSYETVDGKLAPLPVLFRQVVAGMQGIDDPTAKAALAMKVFGQAGLEIMPLLQKSPEELEGIAKRIEELGGGLDPKFIERTAKLTKAQKELGVAGQSFKSHVLASLLPLMTKWANQSTEVFVKLRELNSTGQLTRLMFIGLAGIMLTRLPAMTSAVLAFGKAWLLPIIGIAALGLAAEDVWVAMNGGRSIFGEKIVPEILQLIEDLRSAFALLAVDVTGNFRQMWAEVLDGLPRVASALTAGASELVLPAGGTENADKARLKWASERTAAVAPSAKLTDDQQAVKAYNDRLAYAGFQAQAARAKAGADLTARAQAQGVQAATIGKAGGKTLTINDSSKTELHVHGSTADQAKQVAERAAKLTRLSRMTDEAALLADIR